MTAAKKQEPTWGELGPAMRALPNDKWRAFVFALVSDTKGHGAATRAALAAGFGRPTTKRTTLTKDAYHLRHDERVIAAIAEESRKMLRVGHPEAVAALYNVIRDPTHRDHMRAVAALLDRADPVISKHLVDVTHRTEDPDRAALEELKALRKLGTPREKLLELYGPNGLDRLEIMETAETAQRAASAKLIEGKVIEHEPGNG
jgi:hypothetical protein